MSDIAPAAPASMWASALTARHEMTEVTLKFPLAQSAARLTEDKLVVDLGNGVTITSTAPDWFEAVESIEMHFYLKVKGSPPE